MGAAKENKSGKKERFTGGGGRDPANALPRTVLPLHNVSFYLLEMEMLGVPHLHALPKHFQKLLAYPEYFNIFFKTVHQYGGHQPIFLVSCPLPLNCAPPHCVSAQMCAAPQGHKELQYTPPFQGPSNSGTAGFFIPKQIGLPQVAEKSNVFKLPTPQKETSRGGLGTVMVVMEGGGT